MRTVGWALVAALILLAGCGSDDDSDDNADPTTTAASQESTGPTTTTEPPEESTTTTTTTESEELTPEALEGALVTQDEVPGDFALDDDPDEDDSDDLPAPPECQDLIDRFEASDDDSDAAVAFTREADDATIEHELTILDADDPSIDDIRRVVSACESIPFDEDGSAGEVRLSTEEIPDLGEEAIALVLDVALTAPFMVNIDAYGLLTIRGGVGSSLFVTGGLDGETFESTPADRELAQDLASSVDQRLSEIVGG